MLKGAKHHAASAEACLTACGVLVVQFKGLVIADALQGLKRTILRSLRGTLPRAVLSDYSQSVLALTAQQAEEMMQGRGPENFSWLPAVVVPAPGSTNMLHDAAVTAAIRHGDFRAIAQDRDAGFAMAGRLIELAATPRGTLRR